MENWCSAKKTKLDLSMIRYSPESNAITEQYNRSVLKKTNVLRFEAGLRAEYWNEARQITIYL